MSKPERQELRWVVTWAVVIVLFSSLPYIWGLFFTPPGCSFLGLTHNIDDGAVYLSWMRQAADGHFFIRNLFTNEAQPALQFNVLFLVMGWFAAITHLPLIVVYHLFRIGLGIALVLGIWQFSKLFLDQKQRRLLVPLVGLSAGIGWMIPGAKAPIGSVDVWQPEAITFLSIYLNPLFLAGLLLMLGSFYWLELARRDGKAKYAVLAGLHLLVLGNVHTYDLLTLACVWGAYLAALTLAHFRLKIADSRLGRIIALSLLAAAVALPSVAYQFYVYAGDPIYRLRANTPIPSPPLLSYFEGYGLILVGAVIAAVLLLFNLKSKIENHKWLLPIVWSVVGFAVPYIPIAQQRKLVMGLQIPLCILCAYALTAVLGAFRSMKTQRDGSDSTGIWSPRLVEIRILLLSIVFWMFVLVSPLDFMLMDMQLLNQARTVTHYSPFMSSQDLAAMWYLRAHGKPSDSIYAPPDFALFAPALTGVAVYYGHWSETPDYRDKLLEFAAGVDPSNMEGEGLEALIGSGSTYLVAPENQSPGYLANGQAQAYVQEVFPSGRPQPGDTLVYRVRQP